jgi:intergrase/recombinase
LKQDFVAWLHSRGVNWDHYAKCLVSKLDRYSRPIGEPMDVVRMFNELNYDSQKRHLVNGLRNLFNFCQAQGLADKQWLDLLRSNLPKTSVDVDLKVPSEGEIVEALKRIRDANANPRYFALYNLLLDSGLRVTEAIMLFNGLVSQPGYAVAPLGYFRGTKLAYYAFVSDYTLELIAKCQKPTSYKKIVGTASKRFHVVSYKYLRKFAFDTMTSEQFNIPESVADFIEGRTPGSVGARHYMLLKRKAVQFYPRYAEYVVQLRSKTSTRANA